MKSRVSLNGYGNQTELFPGFVFMSVDGTKAVRIKMIRNPTLLGADLLTDYSRPIAVDDIYSAATVDTTAKTYTGGDVLMEFKLQKIDS